MERGRGEAGTVRQDIGVNYAALIKFAPVFTLERFDDPAWGRPGRNMYESGGLEFLPSVDSIPLIVDHDEQREIGRVHKLFRMEWTDGPWICASATVTEPSTWLQHGTRASFGYKPLHRRDINIRGRQPNVIARALVKEVSVLNPGLPPAEQRAEVLSFHAAEPPGEVIIHNPPVLVRRYFPTEITIR